MGIPAFVHESLSQRVRFDVGRATTALAEEVERVGAKRVMVIASKRQAAASSELWAGVPVAGVHHEVVMHVPRDVANRAVAAARALAADALVSVGGGSAVGLAKAIARETSLPIIAVPTTYAGSEATDVWGVTEGGVKTVGVDARVLPRAVIYDPLMLAGLSREAAAASGLNALAHSVDSLWAPRADPINGALAIEGASLASAGLRALIDAAEPDADASALLLTGSYLGAVAFASAGSGLHHKLCHVLGGSFGLPHAETHAVMLPHVTALNEAALSRPERLAGAVGASTASAGIARIAADLGVPTALAQLGFTDADVDRAAEQCLAVLPAGNPVTLDKEKLVELLRAALVGAP